MFRVDFFLEFFKMYKYLNLKFKQTSFAGTVAFPKKLFYFECIEYEGKYKYAMFLLFINNN